MKLQPATLRFGQQPIDAAGPIKQVTLRNSGNLPLAIAGINRAGVVWKAQAWNRT